METVWEVYFQLSMSILIIHSATVEVNHIVDCRSGGHAGFVTIQTWLRNHLSPEHWIPCSDKENMMVFGFSWHQCQFRLCLRALEIWICLLPSVSSYPGICQGPRGEKIGEKMFYILLQHCRVLSQVRLISPSTSSGWIWELVQVWKVSEE